MAAEPPKPTPPVEPVELIDLGPEMAPASDGSMQGQVDPAPVADAGLDWPAPLANDASALEILLGLGPRSAPDDAPAATRPSSPELAALAAMPMLELDDSPEPSHAQRIAPPTPPAAQARTSAAQATPASDDDGMLVIASDDVAEADAASFTEDLGFAERTPESINTQALLAQTRAQPGDAPATVETPTPSTQSLQMPLHSADAAQATNALAPGARFAPRRASTRTWLMATGLVVLTGGGAAVAYTHQHAAQTPSPQTAQTAEAHTAKMPKQAVMPRSEAPKTARPHLSLVPSVPLPAPKAARLTQANIDALDYASLQAGVQALDETEDDAREGLRLWALFRLASAFDDTAALTRLGQAVHETPKPHAPLAQVAQVAYRALSGRPEASVVALRGLKGPAAKLTQARFVALWAAGRAKGAGFAPLPKQVTALEAMARSTTLWPDAQVLLAQWRLREGTEHRASVAAWAKAAQSRGDAGTQARLLASLIEAEAWPLLDEALGPPELDDQAQTREALVQAAPAHQDLLWRLRVHRHVRLGQFEAAMHLAEQRAQAEPKHAEAQAEWQRLAEYLAPGAADAARKTAPPKTDVNDAAADMMTASRQLFEAIAQGDHDAAATPISTMMHLAASLPTPWAQLAQAEQAGNWKDAAHALDGLLWRDPTIGDPVDDMLQLIELTHRGGDSARAAQEAEALVKNLPHDDRPPMLLAQMAQQVHHSDDRVHWLSTILERHPHARSHTLALAMALTDANRAPEALTALSTLATLDPEARDAEFLYVQGRALGKTNPVAARTVLLASGKQKPQIKTFILLSEIEQARGQLDDAGDAMRQAIALAPEQWKLKVALARLLMPKKGYQEAAEVLGRVLADEPGALEAAELLGDILHEQGNIEEAAKMYARAAAPKDASAPLLLKFALLQMHELKDSLAAEKTLRRAVATDPKAAEPYYYLGLALHDRNAGADAKKQLQTYLRLSPDGPFVSDAQEAMQGL